MPMQLEGSCHCGAVSFRVQSHTPVPYQLCYCSICRKASGDGGYSINIGAITATMQVTGRENTALYHPRMPHLGPDAVSEGERHFCTKCGSHLWAFDHNWADYIYPVAGAIDTPLPVPPVLTHIFLGSKAPWVSPKIGPDDTTFDEYPVLSLDDWHKERGLWVA